MPPDAGIKIFGVSMHGQLLVDQTALESIFAKEIAYCGSRRRPSPNQTAAAGFAGINDPSVHSQIQDNLAALWLPNWL